MIASRSFDRYIEGVRRRPPAVGPRRGVPRTGSMKCKVYATDEGFGPLVRESAVIEELRAMDPDLDITFQTHKHLEDARWILNGTVSTFVDRYNNIEWAKHPDGSPDLDGIRAAFTNYEARSDAFIEAELADFDYDFIISDFVSEGFRIGRRAGVPAFGVAHFTWDWFFSKLYPMPLGNALLERFTRFTRMADTLFFPPFTPREILKQYRENAREVPLVVRKHEASVPAGVDSEKFKVLVIDSGSEVLREHMATALRQVPALEDDFHFFVSAELGVPGENVTHIRSKELFIDHIPHVDLVIARAGFNTISECIAFRTPMLLVGEAMNPEMSENMMNLKNEGLGSFVSLERFTRDLGRLLPHFVEHEYRAIHQAMREHEIPTAGARMVAEQILHRVHSGALAAG